MDLASSTARVLIVEDDRSIAEAMAFHVGRGGFETEVADDGLEAMRALRRQAPDLLVLDLMLPHLDGWQIIREVRGSLPQLPIIVVTARTSERDRIDVLALGADDVVSKPFSMRELVARVSAALRRMSALGAGEAAGTQLTTGDLEIDVVAARVTLAGRPVDLTPREFQLLVALARHTGQVMTRDQIFRLVWEGERVPGDRSVDVLVRRLRTKVDDAVSRFTHVQTLHGVGYRLEALARVAPGAGPDVQAPLSSRHELGAA
jgi:DNA-binding response OmpR family regulator